MSELLDQLGRMSAGAILFGNLTYVLLITSMLMRRMVWLRAIAVTSAVLKIYYRLYVVPDPISVIWECLFVLVNLGQLAFIWFENSRARFGPRERAFLDKVAPGVRPIDGKALINTGEWRDLPPETALTTDGKYVGTLMFISTGLVRIEKNSVAVAICGPGDFVGEMSFVSGDPASADAVTSTDVSVLALEREKLDALLLRLPALKHSMEGGLNRNLVQKLAKANRDAASEATG